MHAKYRHRDTSDHSGFERQEAIGEPSGIGIEVLVWSMGGMLRYVKDKNAVTMSLLFVSFMFIEYYANVSFSVSFMCIHVSEVKSFL